MAEVYDGVIYGDYSKYTRLRINYTVSQDETTAVSTITMNLYAERTKGSEQYNNSGQAYWNLTGKGNTSIKFTWAASSLEMYLGSSSTTVKHNPDGTGAVTLSGYWYTGRTGSNYIPEAISVSQNIKLKTIPRASTITCSTADIGKNPTISIKRASDTFTHTITYVYGSGDLVKTGTIANKTNLTTITGWTIPDNFYQNIPNNREGTGSLTCTTYSGDTVVGTSTCTFTVKTVESEAKPIVSATIKDTNSATIALTGDANKLIKGKSTAQLVINSTLRKHAGSIKSVTVNGTNVGTTASITKTYSNVATSSYSIITTDSRDYPSETFPLNPTMIDYVPLTLNTKIFRPQPTGTEIQMTYSGNYFNGSFGAVANTLSITWKYRTKGASSWTTGGTITPTLSGNTIAEKTISLGTTYNYQTAYEFQIIAVDKLTTNTQTIPISVGLPVFYWGKDFFNIIGQIRETLKLDTNTGIYWKEKNYGDQFQIIPDFNGYDDNNKLKIMGAVGGTGTQPELVDLMTISGRNGYVTANGYYDKGSMLTLPAGNDDYTYWNSLQNGWYWHDNNYPVANLPSDWGFVEKRGFVGADFTITYYKQSSGTIYRKSGNAWSCSGWEIISNPAVILYDNASGTTGTITLSETVANFSYIEIFYNCENRASIKVDNPNGKTIMLTITQWVDKKRTFMSKATLSGTSLTRSENYFADSDGYRQEYTGIYITKVVGYR